MIAVASRQVVVSVSWTLYVLDDNGGEAKLQKWAVQELRTRSTLNRKVKQSEQRKQCGEEGKEERDE